MAKRVLSEIPELLKEFSDRLLGDKGPEWVEIFKSVFRKDFDVQEMVERLGGIEGVRRLLSDELEIAPKRILKHICRFPTPACEKFVAAEHFVVDTSDSAKVRLHDLSEDFKGNFLYKTEENIPRTDLAISKLSRDSRSLDILKELDGRAEIKLFQLWHLLTLQPRGEEKGVLLVDGSANTCFIKPRFGEFLGVVYVRWSHHRRWFIDSGYTDSSDDYRRPASSRVVSRW